MTTQQKKRPIDTLRDGSIKAVIWKNQSEKGSFYSVDIIRTYKDDAGNYHDTNSFSGTQLLRAARLAEIAYTEIGIYRAKDKAVGGS